METGEGGVGPVLSTDCLTATGSGICSYGYWTLDAHLKIRPFLSFWMRTRAHGSPVGEGVSGAWSSHWPQS